MATIGDIKLEESSTITARLAAAQITRNSTIQFQEIMCIGDPDSTNSSAVAAVTNAAPASTTYGLAVRIASGPSSAADLLARVNQGVGNSSAADRWRVNVANSSAADFVATRLVDSSGTGFHGPANPLPIATYTSSGGGVEGSTTIPAVTVTGLHVRPVPPLLQTAASTQGSGSTSSTVVSSNAASYARVLAYSVMSTVSGAGPIRGGFYSGATLLWPVLVWADGGVPKDQLAVSHPSFLFSGSTGVPLTWHQDSTGDVTVAITYWTGA